MQPVRKRRPNRVDEPGAVPGSEKLIRVPSDQEWSDYLGAIGTESGFNIEENGLESLNVYQIPLFCRARGVILDFEERHPVFSL